MADENQSRELMKDTDYAALIYEKYNEHFDHYYELLKFAQAALMSHRSLAKDSYHTALLYIAPRAFKSFDSIRRLCEVVACEDAAVVLRCILNLMAVTRWISLDQEKRAKKFLGWYWVELQERAEQRPDMFPAKEKANIQKRFDAEKSQFEVTRKGKLALVEQWYQPEVNNIFELFKEVDLDQEYREAYVTLSGIEHSDVMAFFPMFAGAEFKDGERKLAIQSDMFVRNYLRNGFQYFADILGTCNKTIPFADVDGLRKIVDAGMAFYKADLAATKLPQNL
jgi:hypothetical protein